MTSRAAAGHPHVEAEQTITLRIAGGLSPEDAPRLSEELRQKLRDRLRGDGPPGAPLARGEPGRPPVTVDVAGLTRIDLAVVDTLARLQLTARRQGTRIELSGAGPELMLLLALVGLSGPAGIGEAARAGPGE
ncbi:STAS domain-containing protein [Streptomyces zhihengii]|uniref:STAS domain-containing protein n=1 Tax=Streptomyces zhihengii TaxID=1818004 RepID=A0ABS2UR38_9ACTN|nr:STAS domain-containing protein [Streptomyces zhihengii]MBM9619753.1 STAS domain-containing protein [Streptomyces zhihengii]